MLLFRGFAELWHILFDSREKEKEGTFAMAVDRWSHQATGWTFTPPEEVQ